MAPLPPWLRLCSSLDPPLSRQSSALAHLDSFLPQDLVLWTDGSLPSPLGKGGSGVLDNCSLCGTQATFSFSANPVCSSFSAKACAFCTLFAGLGSTNKPATFLLFLSDSRSVLTTLSFPLISNSVANLAGTVFSLLLFCQATMGPQDIRFSRETTWLISWPDRERCLRPLQSLVVSLLLSLVSTLLFSRTGGVLSHRSSSTRRFPQFPPRNLCSLVMIAVFSLVFAVTNTAFF